jgi:hypothetical protein
MRTGDTLRICVVSGRRSVKWSEPQAVRLRHLIDRGCTGGVLQQRSSAYGMINNAAAPTGRCCGSHCPACEKV